jgi:NhaA family Na+:H+ antiporter
MLREFLRLESAAGIILMAAAVLAIVADNSPLAPYYDLLLSTKVVLAIGNFEIAKPLILWINDGLMAVFFFLIGLELKRELKVGALSTRDQALLPLFAAIGGMAIPALILLRSTAPIQRPCAPGLCPQRPISRLPWVFLPFWGHAYPSR